ncbi:MAG: YfbR-like 5'-deoxynucleotidase [Dehalococcoidia bacterium]
MNEDVCERMNESIDGMPGPDTNGYICTYTGVHFDFMNPTPEMVRIQDIAHALALTNRWGGHTTQPSNVAQHSLIVWRIIRDEFPGNLELQLYALLHDAPEAYLPDMPAPMKKHLESFRMMDANIEEAIFEAFDVKIPDDFGRQCVKCADIEAYRWEARDLMHGASGVADPCMGDRPMYQLMPWQRAEEVFTQVLVELMSLVATKRADEVA